MTWPAGVRRYSYRKDPELPAGNFPNHDNVQLAFNVLPADQKAWYPCPPGTMPGYIGYRDTDYEYALNPVATNFGGGTEIWRLQVPGMPHKHFYPREPKSPLDGAVKDGKLVIVRDGNTRIVEASLPWSEIPEVRKALDAGRPIKFSFRVSFPSCAAWPSSTARSRWTGPSTGPTNSSSAGRSSRQNHHAPASAATKRASALWPPSLDGGFVDE